MNHQTFLESFGYIADAPGGIDKLRRLILDLAVRGKLVPQDPREQPAGEILVRILAGLDTNSKRPRRTDGQPVTFVEDASIPSGWAHTRLGDLGSWSAGATPSRSNPKYWGGSIPWLKSGELNDGYVAVTEEFITDLAFRDTSVKLRMPGDVLIAMYAGATIGRTAILQFEGTTNQAVCGCTPHSGVVGRFLQYLLRSERDNLAAQGAGSAQANISKEKIVAHVVALPPTAEQLRIVERVDELMSLCENLEEQQAARVEARSALSHATLHRVAAADPADELRAAIDAFTDNIGLHLAPGDGDLVVLRRLRQTILDLAVRGRLTHQNTTVEPASEFLAQIAAERERLVKVKATRKRKPAPLLDPSALAFDSPEGWEWSSLGQLVLSSDSGWSPACLSSVRSDATQWAVLKVSAVSWGTFRAGEHKLLTPGLDPRPQIEVQDGDFIMSRANTAKLVGRSVVAADPPPRLMLSDKHVRLRFRDPITAEFANLVNGSSQARTYYEDVATGTSDSMRNITRDQIHALPVPIPPLAEQTRIVDRVAELNLMCDQMEQQFVSARSARSDLSASIAAHAASTDPVEEAEAAPSC